MAKWLPEKLTRGQLLTVLSGLVLAAVAAVAVLLVLPKSTVVELTVRVDEVGLTAVPPVDGVAELLDSELEVRSLRWRGAESFAATLAPPRPGRATAVPPASGAITLRRAADAAPFAPVVRLARPLRLEIVPARRDQLAITFSPVGDLAARRLGFTGGPRAGDWLCQVPAAQDLELRLRGVELTLGRERLSDPGPRLDGNAAAIELRGGGRPATLGLRLDPPAVGGTAVRVLDPRTGELSAPAEGLDLSLPQERMVVPMGEELVVLEHRPDSGSGPLLAPDLAVVAPSFSRFEGTGRERSFLRGGRIRFPAGEREAVELEPGFLLRLPAETELRLRSLRLAGGDLELVLWGQPASVELGPTPELMDELLPSLFVWLSTHRLPALIFSAVGAVVAAVLALLKLLGLIKKD